MQLVSQGLAPDPLPANATCFDKQMENSVCHPSALHSDDASKADWRGAWVAVFAFAMLPVAVGTVWEERLFDEQPDIDIAVVCFWPNLYSLILCGCCT